MILTLENVKSRNIKVTVYLYDEDKDKRIQGSLILIESTDAIVKHTFKFDNDHLPQNVGPRTQVIPCIEFKNGKGEPIMSYR